PNTAVLRLSHTTSLAPLDQLALMVLQVPPPSAGVAGVVPLLSQVRFAAWTTPGKLPPAASAASAAAMNNRFFRSRCRFWPTVAVAAIVVAVVCMWISPESDDLCSPSCADRLAYPRPRLCYRPVRTYVTSKFSRPPYG